MARARELGELSKKRWHATTEAARRFSSRFFLFSYPSFLVIDFFLALSLLNAIIRPK